MTPRTAEPAAGKPERRREKTRTPGIYQGCDVASAALIIFLAIATPWFFGTTEAWAVWIMNSVCYAAGLLLIAKRAVRHLSKYEPARWVEAGKSAAWFRWIFFGLNLLVLGYCLIAAVNGRATFHYQLQQFEYHDDYVKWLPFSYDDSRSWFVFWQYLGLFCFFWALRDWLIGKSRRERHRVRRTENEEETGRRSAPLLPDRMRWLLWIICINGMAVAVQGILQRLDGSSKLLWLRESYWGRADACFGPFSYRSNASQYLNLIWPVCVGFWWMLNEARRSAAGKPLRWGEGPHLLLVPATIVMAAAPVISISRGGAFVAVMNLVLVVGVFIFHRRTRWSTRMSLIVVGTVTIFMAWFLGWEKLEPRLRRIGKDNLSGRGEIYENSQLMAEQFKWFGTGPGTFRSVYQMYRQDPNQPWDAHLHDDWFETRVTFGRIGFALVFANLLMLLGAWFVPGKIEAPFLFPATIWIALAGCLLHAKFDFPLQVYSVLFMFILLSGVLFCLSKRSEPAA